RSGGRSIIPDLSRTVLEVKLLERGRAARKRCENYHVRCKHLG
ncbi:hypothetical protein L195_g043448, partial [Trifolium pratense]